MRPFTLILGLAAIVGGSSLYRRFCARPTGSTTNASDAMDDIHLPPNASIDEVLDAGVKETFPASDPVSVSRPDETAYEKQQRRKQRSA